MTNNYSLLLELTEEHREDIRYILKLIKELDERLNKLEKGVYNLLKP